MFVEQIISRARERLAVIEANAPVREAARLLMRPHTDLIVVCNADVAVGVISKSDILGQVGEVDVHSALAAPVSTIMTREILSCLVSDRLLDVLVTTRGRGLQRIPVLTDARASGRCLHARCSAGAAARVESRARVSAGLHSGIGLSLRNDGNEPAMRRRAFFRVAGRSTPASV